MVQIKTLTPEEEALLPIVRDEWLKIGLATGPADRGAAQAAIADAYRIAGLEPPSVWVWLDSPCAGCLCAWILASAGERLPNHIRTWARNRLGARVWNQMEQVWNQVGEQVHDQVYNLDEVWDQVTNQVGAPTVSEESELLWDPVRDQLQIRVWNQTYSEISDEISSRLLRVTRHHVLAKVRQQVYFQVVAAIKGQDDAAWLSFFDFFQRIGRLNGLDQLTPILRAAAATSWWWPFAGACVISERPVAHFRDEAGRLHNANGPALAFPDNWAVHAWHGLRIPA
jgi:hypothetical protein